MRLGVLVGEDQSGKWQTLALPDKSIQDQKALFKKIKIEKGVGKSGKKETRFQRLLFFDSYTRRAFFRDGVKIPSPIEPPAIV